MFESPPTYDDPKGEFTTDFRPLSGPGFFPVHSGRLIDEGASRRAALRIVIFGTDWGAQHYAEVCRQRAKEGRACDCQLSLRPASEGTRPNETEPKLFDALTEAGLLEEPATVALTNAVLGLARQQTGNERVFRKHPEYLRDCGAYHRQWLNRQKPRLAVLVGTSHFRTYAGRIWSVVWPELFGPGGVWHGQEFGNLVRSNRAAATAASGLRIQLAYHPSSRQHWWNTRKQTVQALKEGSSLL